MKVDKVRVYTLPFVNASIGIIKQITYYRLQKSTTDIMHTPIHVTMAYSFLSI